MARRPTTSADVGVTLAASASGSWQLMTGSFGTAARSQTLLLMGGNEWQPGAEPADRWWLGQAREPRVTILATANRAHPQAAVALARRYFAELGAEVEDCPLRSGADAADPEILGQLRFSSAVYLAGGDPGAVRQILVGSPAAEVLANLLRSAVPLAGSSAGAMVLGGVCLLPGEGMRVAAGLGVVPRAVVAPHWNSAGASWRRVALELARTQQVLAIDEQTGVCWDGDSWSVRGPGRAVMVTGGGEKEPDLENLSPPLE